MKSALIGWAVTSGWIATCSQVFAWVVRRESDYDLNFSWLGAYVASAAFVAVVASIKTQK